MRTIKFRAWDGRAMWPYIPRMDWIDGELRSVSRYVESDISGGDWETDYAKDIQVMQFTGLLDKNGKEIYEGDIIDDKRGQPKEVVFHEGAFSYKLGESYFNPEYYEVIGNIYENPELLTSNQ